MGIGERVSHFQLLTRPDCHLCNEMALLLDEILPSYGLSYESRNVDEDEGWRRRFGDVVPVLLRDGRPVAKIRLDRRRLQRIVRRRR